MKFLSLVQGDPIGKDLFLKLIDARYGAHPPGMDALRVTFEGRSRAKLGPLPIWARVKAVATYRFPTAMKWSFKIRVLRLLNSSYVTSFDGETVFEEQGGRVSRDTSPQAVESARRRAWAETVFFVSPLIADDRVRVEGVEPGVFKTYLAATEDVATVRLHANNTVREIEIERMDPATDTYKKQFIRPVGQLSNIDGLILPEKIQRYWDDELLMELTPIQVELNPPLADDEFALAGLLAGVLDADDDDDDDAGDAG